MDTIYLNHHESQIFEACSLLDRSRQFSGQSMWEIEEALAAQRDAKANRLQRRHQSQVALDHRLEGYKNDALNRKGGALVEISKAEKIRDIRSNRKLERNLQRPLEAFVTTQIENEKTYRTEVSLRSPTDSADDDLEVLRNARNRRSVPGSDDDE
jgi:hypothetical protein